MGVIQGASARGRLDPTNVWLARPPGPSCGLESAACCRSDSTRTCRMKGREEMDGQGDNRKGTLAVVSDALTFVPQGLLPRKPGVGFACQEAERGLQLRADVTPEPD